MNKTTTQKAREIYEKIMAGHPVNLEKVRKESMSVFYCLEVMLMV